MTHTIPADVRAAVTGRDKPPGTWAPLCWVCGQPVTGYVEIHHRKYLGRGGDDRPSNLISLHPQRDGPCHLGKAHGQARRAAGEPDPAVALWAISRHARDGVYYEPVWHAGRGWCVLDDEGGWRPAAAAEAEGLPSWPLRPLEAA